MDIREALIEEHSKAQAMRIASYIGNDAERFATLMRLFLQDEWRITQRAAWVVMHCVEAHPKIVVPHLPEMIDNLKRPVHDAVKRNSLRIMKELDISEDLLGDLTTICFDLLASPKEPTAIHCFSMEILHKVCLREPALSDELCLLIEDGWEHGTPGFHSRGRKVLKALAPFRSQ